MSLEDILKRTNKRLSERVGKKTKPFSFGHDMPSLAIEDGSGDPNLWIPSGVTPLDCALGGGIAMGRVTELFSDDAGDGKSTLALHFAKSVQKVGGAVIWLESETALDKVRASGMGVDLNRLIKWTPDTLEDGFRYIGEIIKNISEDKDQGNKPTLIVWDTIAMARTEAERDGDAFRDGLNAGPRAISTALKNYSQEFSAYNVHLLLVNQSYTDIGNPKSKYLGVQYQTPGGKRIKFSSSYRIKCKKVGFLGIGRNVGPKDEKLGIKVRITIVKNKLALPYRYLDINLYGNTGYSDIMSMAELFVEKDGNPYHWLEGLSVKSGGRYKPIHSDKSGYWWELDQLVTSNTDTYRSWVERWKQIFPIHDSRQLNENGWYYRVPGSDTLSPTPNGILSQK